LDAAKEKMKPVVPKKMSFLRKLKVEYSGVNLCFRWNRLKNLLKNDMFDIN
jgi:hypothetical protein